MITMTVRPGKLWLVIVKRDKKILFTVISHRDSLKRAIKGMSLAIDDNAERDQIIRLTENL